MSTKKGIKRTRDVPIFYEELNKKRTITLTDTAWLQAAIKAKENGISVSEYLERFLSSDGK